MDVEVVPEPSPDERQAIVAALAEVSADRAPEVAELYESRWRIACLHENAGDEAVALD